MHIKLMDRILVIVQRLENLSLDGFVEQKI